MIRYEGPKGGPGMREMAFFRLALKFAGMTETNYIITDGRFSGYSDGPSIGYLSPEAAEGGNIALVQDGDVIEIDIENRKLEMKVPDQELKRRKETLVAPIQKVSPGVPGHLRPDRLLRGRRGGGEIPRAMKRNEKVLRSRAAPDVASLDPAREKGYRSVSLTEFLL